MTSHQLDVVPDPPYASYQRLKSHFPHVRFVQWTDAGREEEGLAETVSGALAGALVSCGSVLFLHSHPYDDGTSEWKNVSPQTWQITKRAGLISKLGRKWQFCFSRNADSVRQLFYDDQYSWHLRGQLALLFPGDGKPENLRLQEVIRSLQEQDLTNLADCIGYLRPGDDGDFAEFGAGNLQILDRFRIGLGAPSSL